MLQRRRQYQSFLRKAAKVFASLPQYSFEIIFIDNCSTDRTVEKLRDLAAKDHQVRVIVNTRNFGAIRSSYHILLQGHGDAVILMATDLQDPPELLPQLIEKWELGSKVVVATKVQSEESKIIYSLRTAYYKLLNSVASIELVEHFTGFGLYDQSVVVELRKLKDTYPYLRGLISELGYRQSRVSFVQPKRLHGHTHMNWYAMYDYAMLGLTSHSLVPMRIATFTGFTLAIISLSVALFYFFYKLIYWKSFSVGIAPADNWCFRSTIHTTNLHWTSWRIYRRKRIDKF